MTRLGIESYVAVPLMRRNGSVFGTLCALDPLPANLEPADLETFSLLADLVAFEMEAEEERQHRESAEAERRAFVEAVAHDLKSPLQVIKSQAQLLRRRVRGNRPVASDLLDTRLEEIEASVNRGTELINEMLDATRLRSGQHLDLNLQEMDLAAVVGEAVEPLRQASLRHRFEVTLGDGPVVGHWDRSRVARVLANLLGNAIRYSPDGGAIRVSVGREVAEDGTWAVVTVRDEGIGIPAADQPYVFNRYRRGRNVSGKMAGTGIGLAGSRQIVEQHDGTISVASIEGKGSAFTVRLPIE